MNIAEVMDELDAAVGTIEGLRNTPYYSTRINPPASIIGWPIPYTFDATFGRGSDSFTFPLTVLVGNVDARSSRDALAEYANGSGDKSIKQAVENKEYTTCDSVRVERVEFGVIAVAGVEYLTGTFYINVIGEGA